MNAICALDEVDQRSTSDFHNSIKATLNATTKEQTPTQCRKRAENADGRIIKDEGWTKSTKNAPITCSYKQNNKINEKNNVNNNRYDIFTDDVQIHAEHEENLIKK